MFQAGQRYGCMGKFIGHHVHRRGICRVRLCHDLLVGGLRLRVDGVQADLYVGKGDGSAAFRCLFVRVCRRRKLYIESADVAPLPERAPRRERDGYTSFWYTPPMFTTSSPESSPRRL